MTPTWQSDDGAIRLYRADCRDVLPELKGIDAVVTDPPYGIGHPCDFANRGRGALAQCRDYAPVHDDDRPFDPAPLLNYPKAVIWGGNYFADKLPPSSGWLIWDKERPDTLDQATCELAWTNCVKGARRFRHLWNGMMKASERGETYHPTQKPVALFEWILALPWLSDCVTILDPYMGSGPCGVACVKTGRKFIGVEIDEGYFSIAVKRIKAALNATPLFDKPKAKQGVLI